LGWLLLFKPLVLKDKMKNILENERIWDENLNKKDRFACTIYNTLSTVAEY
jgi:hypothetical protein